MKKQIKQGIYVVLTVVTVLLSRTSATGQTADCGMDWDVENATDCNAQVKVEYFCNGSSTPCSSSTQWISSHSTSTFPSCGSSCNNCEVNVTLLWLGPCQFFGGTVNSSNPSLSWSGCISCEPSAGSGTAKNMIWQQSTHLTQIGQ